MTRRVPAFRLRADPLTDEAAALAGFGVCQTRSWGRTVASLASGRNDTLLHRVVQGEISGSEAYRGLHLPAGHEAEPG